MGWIALATEQDGWFSRAGLPAAPDGRPVLDAHADALLTRGSIVFETRLPALRRPRPLFYYRQGGVWPLHLSLQALPGGGLTLILDQNGDIQHHGFDCADAGRTDIIRVTYAWDAPRRVGMLALELPELGRVSLSPVASPHPIRARDIEAMTRPGSERYMAPELLYLAVSSEIEPVGPAPSLCPTTPIATPDGYRPIADLQRGDLVTTARGEAVPVLHTLQRWLPALGSHAPLRLRAPYFGLRQDLLAAPTQKMVLSGSEVDYLFGSESVLLQVGHLAGGASVRTEASARFVRFDQVLLPDGEMLDVAGGAAQSLFIGRLRRKPVELAASVFGNVDRTVLPEHRAPRLPTLRAFDALILAEHRAA